MNIFVHENPLDNIIEQSYNVFPVVCIIVPYNIQIALIEIIRA